MTPEILYEDRDIIVVYKPAGMGSQSGKSFSMDLCSYLKNRQAAQGVKNSYIGVVHRLDRMVAGVMVYAKTKEAAAGLSRQVQSGQMKKYYKALLCGRLSQPEGELVDYLLQDGRTNHSAVVKAGTAGAKEAKLTYRQIPKEELGCVLQNMSAQVVAGLHFVQDDEKEKRTGKREDSSEAAIVQSEKISCPEQSDKNVSGEQPDMVGSSEQMPVTGVEIHLLTGRHHQIRVQFSHRGTPLWGDTKYNPAFQGVRTAGVALCAWRLAFCHPRTGKQMEFSLP